MNSTEVELLGRNWPEQIIERYDDYYRIWRAQYKDQLAPRTEEHYASLGREWCRFANGKNLTPGLLLAWHGALLRRPSMDCPRFRGRTILPEQINKMNARIRKFLGWLKLVGVIGADPSVALPNLREPEPPPPKLYLHEEYLKIVQYGSTRPKLEPILFLIVLGYHTGMGLVDCCHLRWDEVVLRDNEPSYIQKTRAKLRRLMGRKSLFTIPIIPGSELWVWMKRMEARRPFNYKRQDGIEYVHQDLPGMYDNQQPPLSNLIVKSMIKPALGSWQAVGGRSFRHFRNSFCSRLINAGVDSLLVSKMTGHSTLVQLSGYVLPNLRAMQEALVSALRWAEGESGPDMPRNFLALPSPPSSPAVESSHTQPATLATEAGGAAVNERP